MKLNIILIALASLMAGCASTDISSSKSYPLDVCIVSGNKLGSMGDPYKFEHEGREIKLCCKPCIRKFNKNPEKYLVNLPKK
ncbi:MAG: hypothetical protein H8E20_16060 [Verrucomicrobia bacterium]|nr:hypothetical protein [Verrucomicrobiota bacterium]